MWDNGIYINCYIWSLLLRGAWIEIFSVTQIITLSGGRSSYEERGLKLLCNKGFFTTLSRSSYEERGLKCSLAERVTQLSHVAPLTRSVD